MPPLSDLGLHYCGGMFHYLDHLIPKSDSLLQSHECGFIIVDLASIEGGHWALRLRSTRLVL